MALKDIAAEVGVSISTVSRVLNKDHTSAASEELKRQIWAVAQKQGYMPNLTARRLKSQKDLDIPKARSLCCIYGCAPQETKDDPFFSKLLEYVEHEAFRHGYHISCAYSSLADAKGYPFASTAASPSHSDCLIILGRFDPKHLEYVTPYFKNIVYVGLNFLDAACDQIVCNGYKMLRAGVHYLHSLGHQKIAFIGSREMRRQGYVDAVRELGLPVNERHLIDDIFLSMEGGYQGMMRLLEQASDLTAVCSSNDMVAIGALKACLDRGIRIPEDISILGLNNIENVQFTTPMLSSIRVPLDEMGRMAVTLLLDRIHGGHSSLISVEFPFQIISRESCRQAP